MSGPYQGRDLSNCGVGRHRVAINCGVLSVKESCALFCEGTLPWATAPLWSTLNNTAQIISSICLYYRDEGSTGEAVGGQSPPKVNVWKALLPP